MCRGTRSPLSSHLLRTPARPRNVSARVCLDIINESLPSHEAPWQVYEVKPRRTGRCLLVDSRVILLSEKPCQQLNGACLVDGLARRCNELCAKALSKATAFIKQRAFTRFSMDDSASEKERRPQNTHVGCNGLLEHVRGDMNIPLRVRALKYTRYLPQAIATIPSIETLHTIQGSSKNQET